MNELFTVAQNVPLEIHLPEEEQRRLEDALADALQTTFPPDDNFIVSLEQGLVQEAQRQYARQQLLQTLGILGGGGLTIIAGIVGFLVLRRQHKEKQTEETAPQEEAPGDISAAVPGVRHPEPRADRQAAGVEDLRVQARSLVLST